MTHVTPVRRVWLGGSVPEWGDGARGHGEGGVLGGLIVEELLFMVLAVRHGPRVYLGRGNDEIG